MQSRRTGPGIVSAAIAAVVGAVVAAVVDAPPAAVAADATDVPATARRPGARIALEGRVPLFFEANRGQAPEGWDFLVRCTGYHAFVRSGEATFSFDGAGLALSLDGARRVAPDVRGLEMKARANYFLGNDPAKWISGVSLSRGAVYRDVAPGTTWRLGARGRRLEFSLVVPGTDEPTFHLGGARTVAVGADGALRIGMPTGEATFSAPVAWQTDRTGARHPVTARFAVEKDGAVRIALGERDPHRPTCVDPTVSYASYLGGGDEDWAESAAIDPSGGVFLAGITDSADFPSTAGSFDPTPNSVDAGRSDVYVVKLASSGESFAYATYLGSATQDDSADALCADAEGNAYVGGRTYKDYPTTQGVVGEKSTDPYSYEAYVTKLDPDGAAVVWSTFVLDTGIVRDMALGSGGEAYVTDGAYVQRLAADATKIDFRTRLTPTVESGSGERFERIAVTADDLVYAGGYSGEAYAITPGTYQTQLRGTSDACVVKLDASGTVLWKTLVGGSGSDHAEGLGVDLHGRPTIVGTTKSADFPVTSDAWTASASGTTLNDGFLARLTADGKRLRYATYVIGTADEFPSCVRVHPSGAAYVAGYTTSNDFDVTGAFQTSRGGSQDGFLMKFTSRGDLVWSSYTGGTDSESAPANGLALATDGTIVLHGATRSSDLATVSPYQADLSGTVDARFLCVPDSVPTSPTAVRIVTSGFPDWTAGLAFNRSVAGADGVTPYTWTVHSGAPPAGLALSAAGVLSGTPTTAGATTFLVRIADANDYLEEREFTMTVNPAPSLANATIPEWTSGLVMDLFVAATGGTGGLTLSVSSGKLPHGLTLAADGRLSGTPDEDGSWTYTVKAEDALGAVATRTFVQRVNPRPAIAAQSLPDWTTGQLFTASFFAFGGTPPLTWSVAAGKLPTASIDAETSRISGPALAPGTYAFTLQVTDAVGVTATQSFGQTIHELPAIRTAALPLAAVGRPYALALDTTGGTAPLSWALASGSLADGITLDTASGRIAGIPRAPAYSPTLAVIARDAAGAFSQVTLPFECIQGADLSRRKQSESVVFTPGAPASIHRFVELTLGCLIDVKVTGGDGPGGGPSLRLLRADGTPLDLGTSLRATRHGLTVRRFAIPETGRYFVALEAAADAGGKMKMSLSISPPAAWTQTIAVGPGLPDAVVRFAAPPGARASLRAKPAKRSGARPAVVAWNGPDGSDLLAGARSRTSGPSVSVSRKAALPGGDSLVRVAARPGSVAGAAIVSVRLKLPKAYSFALPDLAAGDSE